MPLSLKFNSILKFYQRYKVIMPFKRKFNKRKKMLNEQESVANQIPYETSPLQNEAFENYYKLQGIVPEHEWNQFYFVLQTKLPSAFRITGYKKERKHIKQIISSDEFKSLVNVGGCSQDREYLKRISWYPGELAWQLNLTRKEIRDCDPLRSLHKFLIAETECGNITRQEAVSMIPPLLLDIEPHHKILDLCAAPGSKTSQLIELLHKDESIRPSGFVVANDKDNNRCYMMVHQVKRLESPCVIVTNHDATLLPMFLKYNTTSCDKEYMYFDRILADVPCSGDGTLRKNQELWRNWNAGIGIGLHKLQFKIVHRGLELLAEGGRLVYSTCSFNPIENEAVVSTILKKCEGSVELVDCSDKLPGLRVNPGRKSWKVITKGGKVYENWRDVPQHDRKFLHETMFPLNLEEAEALSLHLCVRILPHHQDTGGFFIAVMEKKRKLPWTKNRPTKPMNIGVSSASHQYEDRLNISEDRDLELITNDNNSHGDTSSGQNTLSKGSDEILSASIQDQPVKRTKDSDCVDAANKKTKIMGHREEPFIFFSTSDPVWPSIRDFYSLPSNFPAEQLMYRCEDGSRRNLYFVSSAVKDLVRNNENKIKFVNMGIKAFARNSSPLVPECDFRIVQEGLSSTSEYITERQVHVCHTDLAALLADDNVPFTSLNESTCVQLQSLCPGSVVLRMKFSCSEGETDGEYLIAAWRGKASLTAFISKNDKQHFLYILNPLPWEKDAKSAAMDSGQLADSRCIEETPE